MCCSRGVEETSSLPSDGPAQNSIPIFAQNLTKVSSHGSPFSADLTPQTVNAEGEVTPVHRQVSSPVNPLLNPVFAVHRILLSCSLKLLIMDIWLMSQEDKISIRNRSCEKCYFLHYVVAARKTELP